MNRLAGLKAPFAAKIRKEIKRLGYESKGRVTSKRNEMFSMMEVDMRGMMLSDQDSLQYFISVNETFEMRQSFEIDVIY